MNISRAVAAAAVVTALALSGCSAAAEPEAEAESTEAMEKTPDVMESTDDKMDKSEDEKMDKSDDAMGAGAYITYEDFEAKGMKLDDSVAVLFFNADWCPTCQGIHARLTDNPNDVPEGVTFVDVDYDKHTDLRQKYGVTMQSTFVQLDDVGEAVTTWQAGSLDEAIAGIEK